MAFLPQTDTWPPDVYQIDLTDPVLGGPDGPPNKATGTLAKRAMYQRLRNVTPWDAALAAFLSYPDKACVMYAGVSWRSKIDGNDVAPGTDPLKWERWGYSQSELDAYMNNLLKTQVLASIGFGVLSDATGAIPGANYTLGQTGNIDANTVINNPSTTKALKLMVVSASARLWNKGGNTAVLGGAGFVSFGGGGGSFNTVSFSGSISPNNDANGGGQFNGQVSYTIPPLGSVTVTNRFTWAVNAAGAVNGGNSLCTSNVLYVKFELPV